MQLRFKQHDDKDTMEVSEVRFVLLAGLKNRLNLLQEIHFSQFSAAAAFLDLKAFKLDSKTLITFFFLPESN